MVRMANLAYVIPGVVLRNMLYHESVDSIMLLYADPWICGDNYMPCGQNFIAPPPD